jgi:hypothetical protein
MEALKWIGCIAAAILVLSTAIGVGVIIGIVVLAGAALLILSGMALLIAAAIRGACASKKK